MGVLDQITQMRNQGTPDEEIIQKLQEQGVSPKSINDALSQAEIKQAVGGNENPGDEDGLESPPAPEASQIMYTPKTQEESEQDFYSPQPPQQQNYSPSSQENYPQEYYPQQGFQGGFDQGYSQGGAGFDTSTIIEISEQVFSEKVQKIQKKLDELNEFKTISEAKITHFDERLKRIESMIDKLQIAILEKIGEYGKNLEKTKKEISMVQDSFGKMANKISDHAPHKTHVTKRKSSKKK